MNDSSQSAPPATLQHALAELPMLAAMLAAANVAAAVVVFQHARCSVVRRLGLVSE